jgi:hypothetical protein
MAKRRRLMSRCASESFFGDTGELLTVNCCVSNLQPSGHMILTDMPTFKNLPQQV